MAWVLEESVLGIKTIVPGGSPIIAIIYNYNSWNVLSFIVTYYTGSTNSVLLYLSYYPDQFLMLSFIFFLIPLSCISSLDLLMRLTHTTNKGLMI